MSTAATLIPGSVHLKGKHLDDLNDDLSFFPNGKSKKRSCENIAEEEEIDEMLEEKGATPPVLQRQSSTPLTGHAAAAAQGRALRKAKRAGGMRAHSISEDGKFGGMMMGGLGGPPGSVKGLLKNSRKSRASGRGLPKKGGAGGKGTWGKLGCELELPWVDPNDPNYESDPENSPDGLLSSSLGSGGHNGTPTNTKLKALVPEMSEEDVRKVVEPLILEFFENNDATEVLFTLQEMLMNLGARRWMIVSILIELAMDHKPSHREMASTLISELYQKVISQKDIGKAFDYLVRQLGDLILDTPDAPTVLGNFMARAIADDCIPPKFLHSYKGQVDTPDAKTALRRADTLLSMKHGMVRLDNVWGVGGGVRPVKYLIKKIVLLLKEYLYSGDEKEAGRCLVELEVPHFHHELVYEAVIMTIEAMHEKTEEAVAKLLKYLFKSFIITIDQMIDGFERVYDFMPELSLDVPAAYSILERFVGRCRKEGLITDELVQKMPSRGRKRFVSEGDGGRIKENGGW